MTSSAQWSDRLENVVRMLLRSFGALFFASGSTAGVFFLLAITIVNPQAGVLSVAGALAACLAATILRGEKLLLEHGIYGFNGVLAGMGSLTFVRPETAPVDPLAQFAWPLLLALTSGAVSGVIVWFYVRMKWHVRPGLPVLSLPSIIALWSTSRIFVATKTLTLSADAYFPPVVDVRWHGWEGIAGAFELWIDRGLPFLPVVVLFLLGYGIEDPRRLLAALVAAITALFLAGAMIGPNAPIFPGFTFYCAPPMALGLGWFFLSPGLKSFLTATIAVVVSAFVWEKTGLFAERHELPLLTLPFALVSFTIQAAIRFAPSALRPLLPTAIPLYRVGAPESPNYGPTRAAGLSYWKNIKKMAAPTDAEVPEKTLDAALAQLTAAQRPCVLTGAGISTESGIPDYRTGIIAWNVYDPAELTFERFLADERARAVYWKMSQDFYVLLRQARPNRAHTAIAELERLGKVKGIITQNVDRLHQRAGSTNVVEIHGDEFGVTCLNCGKKYSRDEIYRWILHGTEVPYCLHCQGFLKPDSIAFGQPMNFESSRRALELADRCDLLIVAGTSLSVDPVAALVARTAARGARLMIINYGPTDFDAVADVLLRGSAGAILEKIAALYKEQHFWVK